MTPRPSSVLAAMRGRVDRSGPRGWAVALLALAVSAGCSGGAPGPSVLLLTLDTTRVDALRAYAEDGAATARLDRLAAEGVRFDAAYTTAPLTLPAHVSLMTGLYPLRHGVRDNGLGALPASATTLAEKARARGVGTAAFVSSVVLDPAFGLDQGFDVYEGVESEEEHGERPAREVVDGALAWLDARDPDDPFLLWLHFYDPHTPSAPHGDVAGCAHPELDASNRARYLREVCEMDAQLGRVLDAVDLDRTLVVAVADHGEAFGEHGEFGHSAHCFDTTLRVPLVVRFPDGRGAGTTRDEIVSLVDLAPSIASWAGWGALDGVDGLPVFDATAPADRGVYFESYYGYLSFGWSPVAGWLDAQGKYVHSSAPEFYVPREDPEERTDRIDDPPVDLRRYQRAIAALADAPRLTVDEDAGTEELLDDLRGLGYVAVGNVEGDLPHPLGKHTLPSPTRMAGPYERSIDALELIHAKRFDEALPILEEVRALNPRNPFVLDLLANCHLQGQRYAQAAEVLRDLVDFSLAEQPSGWARLGACLVELERIDEGVEAWQRAVELAPRRAAWLRELVGVLTRAGRADEALPYFERLRELDD